MRDFNINLLNNDVHITTAHFINTQFSYTFIPLINKPTRVSDKSDTLINNIFTNMLINDTSNNINGIFYIDITDHSLE